MPVVSAHFRSPLDCDGNFYRETLQNSICLSICLSQVGVLSKWLSELKAGFGTGASFHILHCRF